MGAAYLFKLRSGGLSSRANLKTTTMLRLKNFIDRIRLAYTVICSDRVIIFSIEKEQFKQYLRGKDYNVTVKYNCMLEENAKEIILNNSNKFDKAQIADARSKFWGLN